VLIGSALRSMLGFKILPEPPEFVASVERLQARPAFQQAPADEPARAVLTASTAWSISAWLGDAARSSCFGASS
jgi:hypothetical protein